MTQPDWIATSGELNFWGVERVQGVEEDVSSGGERPIHAINLNPHYLHSNAMKESLLGAFAELIDNAVEEKMRGATFVNIDVTKLSESSANSAHMIQIIDDGGGMVPVAFRDLMSLGCSQKLGHHGTGFKVGSVRIGADAIVFTETIEPYRSRSIGLLSNTFLRREKKMEPLVPLISYTLAGNNSFEKSTQQLSKYWDMNLELLTKWSPFSNEEMLLDQFRYIGKGHGTFVLVFNLWNDLEGAPELDFMTDTSDIQIACVGKPNDTDMKLFSTCENLLTYHYSLKSYMSILYRELADFKFYLRGKEVPQMDICGNMLLRETIDFKPHARTHTENHLKGDGWVGILKNHENIDFKLNGCCIYANNRLLMPFFRSEYTPKTSTNIAIGILKFNSPKFDKQSFNHNVPYSKLKAFWERSVRKFWHNHQDVARQLMQAHGRIALEQKRFSESDSPHSLEADELFPSPSSNDTASSSPLPSPRGLSESDDLHPPSPSLPPNPRVLSESDILHPPSQEANDAVGLTPASPRVLSESDILHPLSLEANDAVGLTPPSPRGGEDTTKVTKSGGADTTKFTRHGRAVTIIPKSAFERKGAVHSKKRSRQAATKKIANEAGIPVQAEALVVTRAPPTVQSVNPLAQVPELTQSAAPSTGPDAITLNLIPEFLASPSMVHQSKFHGLVNELAEGADSNLSGQVGDDAPQSVEVTPEESEAIERSDELLGDSDPRRIKTTRRKRKRIANVDDSDELLGDSDPRRIKMKATPRKRKRIANVDDEQYIKESSKTDKVAVFNPLGILVQAEALVVTRAPPTVQSVNPLAQVPELTQSAAPSTGPDAITLNLIPEGLPSIGSRAGAGNLDFLRNSSQDLSESDGSDHRPPEVPPGEPPSQSFPPESDGSDHRPPEVPPGEAELPDGKDKQDLSRIVRQYLRGYSKAILYGKLDHLSTNLVDRLVDNGVSEKEPIDDEVIEMFTTDKTPAELDKMKKVMVQLRDGMEDFGQCVHTVKTDAGNLVELFTRLQDFTQRKLMPETL